MGILPMHLEVTPGGQVMPVRFGASIRRFSYRSQNARTHGDFSRCMGWKPILQAFVPAILLAPFVWIINPFPIL
jgi:hypothetical protein